MLDKDRAGTKKAFSGSMVDPETSVAPLRGPQNQDGKKDCLMSKKTSLASPRPSDKDFLRKNLKPFFRNGGVILLTRHERDQIIDNLVREILLDSIKIDPPFRRVCDDFLKSEHEALCRVAEEQVFVIA